MFLITLIVNMGETFIFIFQQDGTAVSSLVSDFLEKKVTVGASEMEEKAIENIAYTVYGGEPFFLPKKRNLELTWNKLPPIRRV